MREDIDKLTAWLDKIMVEGDYEYNSSVLDDVPTLVWLVKALLEHHHMKGCGSPYCDFIRELTQKLPDV